MKYGPKNAAADLDDFVEITAAPRAAKEILAEILETKGRLSKDDAIEKADRWEIRFLKILEHREISARQALSVVKFAFNSASNSHIQGACFCEPQDSDDVREAKASRAQTIPISKQIEALTPDEFERLCGSVLRLFGVEHPFVSRRSADQGIDFFGQAPFATVLAAQRLPAGAEKNLRVWIVGQAKRYDKVKVSTKDLRELVGSTELARSNTFVGTTSPLAEFRARLCDPVFYMLITSGEFTADSRELIAKSGIIALDKLQLAQFLADNKVCGNEVTPQSFRAWFDQEPTLEIDIGQ